MRLLIVSHLFRNPLEHSNLPNLFNLTQALSADVEVDVIAPVPWFPRFRFPRSWHRFSLIPLEATYGRVRVQYPRYLILPFRLLYLLAGPSFLRTLRAATARTSYDIVWAHYAYPDGWATVRLATERRGPAIVTVRGEDVRIDVRHVRIRKMVGWALRTATVVTSPHPETAELARRLGREDVLEMHNGIDLPRFAHGDGARIRRELGLTDEFVVSFVAHLVRNKDPQSLIQALAMIPREERVVVLLTGSAGRGRRQTDLPALAARLGVSDRVKFLGDRPDVPDILAASDLFTQLDIVENIWSNSMLEAMAARLACIVTRAGTTPEFLRHGKEAWLIPSRSPRDLADAILRLKGDPTLRAELARNGQALVAAGFDLNAVSAQALALCRSLADRART